VGRAARRGGALDQGILHPAQLHHLDPAAIAHAEAVLRAGRLDVVRGHVQRPIPASPSAMAEGRRPPADARIGEARWLGMTISPSYGGEPEGTRGIERFMRALKAQCLSLHQFASLAEARRVIGAFIHRYNTEWLIGRLRYQTPAAARAAAWAEAAWCVLTRIQETGAVQRDSARRGVYLSGVLSGNRWLVEDSDPGNYSSEIRWL